jgi:eukaryotic-like serine/threonine-protein kinase
MNTQTIPDTREFGPSPELNTISTSLTGKYRLLSKLGEGGMAQVYLAVFQGLAGFSKLVVLKVLKRELARVNEFQDAFMREARLCARMNHPNIVAVNEIEIIDGLPAIVMEHLQGQALSNVLHRVLGKETLDFHLHVLMESLSGLHYAHELTDFDGTPLRLVHCDFNPQNIFLTYEGSVKVLDFGIAQATRSAAHRASDSVQGKLHYMAPEQVTSTALDRRTDVFAAGIILCELVTGRRFWNEISNDSVMERLKTGDIPTAGSLMSDCPSELVSICSRALAVPRGDRYQTIAEMLRDIESYIESKSRHMTTQDVRQRIARWFAQERQQAQQFIESNLSNDNYGSWSRITISASQVDHTSTPSTATVTIRDLPRRSSPISFTDYAKPVRRRLQLAAVGAVIAFVCGLAMVYGQIGKASPKTGGAAQSLAADVKEGKGSVAAAQPQSVAIQIKAVPESATILIDDIASTDNPYTRDVTPSSDWHDLRVEAPGYKSYQKRVQFLERTDLVVELEAEGPLHPKAPHVLQNATSGTTGRTPTPKGKLACSPPYTYDETGVKHFKPECL